MKWLSKLEPSDHGVERSVIVAVLADRDVAYEVIGVLSASDFSFPAHAAVFAAMKETWGEALAFAWDSLSERASAHADSDLARFIGSLIEESREHDLDTTNATAEAAYIFDLSICRKLMRFAFGIVETVAEGNASAGSIKARAHDELAEIDRQMRRWDFLTRRRRELRAMPYPEYLQSDEWRAKRTAQVCRDGFACRLCNSRENLNVHHRTYERRGDEAPGDLITLCHDCHQLFHDNAKLVTTEG